MRLAVCVQISRSVWSATGLPALSDGQVRTKAAASSAHSIRFARCDCTNRPAANACSSSGGEEEACFQCLRSQLESRPPLIQIQDSFFFAASGTSSLVLPTSLISTVVVPSMSRSFPPKLMVPCCLSSYLVSRPSFVQNLTEPLAFF